MVDYPQAPEGARGRGFGRIQLTGFALLGRSAGWPDGRSKNPGPNSEIWILSPRRTQKSNSGSFSIGWHTIGSLFSWNATAIRWRCSSITNNTSNSIKNSAPAAKKYLGGAGLERPGRGVSFWPPPSPGIRGPLAGAIFAVHIIVAAKTQCDYEDPRLSLFRSAARSWMT